MADISADNRTELEKRYRIAAFIVIAQIVSTLFLIVIAFFTARSGASAATQPISTLWIIILFIAVGSFILRRFFFNWEKLKNTAILKGVCGLIKSLQTNSIILSSIGELIAVVGFFSAMLEGDKWNMLRAGVVAIIVFLANFPRKSNWEKIVANLETL